MSGIFRKKSTNSDYDAFMRFVRGSKTTILSDSSNHALVLKIAWTGDIEDHVKVTSVPSVGAFSSTAGGTASGSFVGERAASHTVSSSMLVGSPYARIWYDPRTNDIVIDDVRELVLKLVPINLKNVSKDRTSGSESSIRVEGMRGKYVSAPMVWWNEVIVQRLAFNTSFMIDFQMQAVTPNVIIAFFVKKLKDREFYELFNLESGETRLRSFLDAVFHYEYTVGCMLMEYMEEAKDFEDYGCIMSQGGTWGQYNGTFSEMNECMEAKAHLLVQIDKLHYVGILHKDLHTRNAMKYKNPSGRICGCVIDFGKSTIVTDRDECQEIRARNFNNLDVPATDYIYKKYNSQDAGTYYIQKCIVKRESNPHIVVVYGIPRSTNYFKEWNMPLFHTDPIATYERYHVINKNACKYINYKRMNEIDAEMVKNGKAIRGILYDELKITDASPYITLDKQNEGRYSRSLKNGGNSILHAYLEIKGLSENCDSMLQNNDPFCITNFDPNSEISMCLNSACSSSSASSSSASSSSASSSSSGACEGVLRDKRMTELGKVMSRLEISPCGKSSAPAATSSLSAAGGGLSTTPTSTSSLLEVGGGGLGPTLAATSSSSAAEGKTNSRKNRSRKPKTRRAIFRKTRRNNRTRF